MKYLFLLSLLLGMLLAIPGRAQPPCTITANPAGCANAIRAFDVQTGAIVEAFCIGRPVRFRTCGLPAQAIPIYGILPGTNTTVPGTRLPSCTGTGDSTVAYTPTAAGPVTVFANANDGNIAAFLFARVYQVFDASRAPTATIAPCADGNVVVTVDNTSDYDYYEIQAGANPLVIVRRGQSRTVTVPVPAGTASLTVTGRFNLNGLCATAPFRLTIPAALPNQVPTFSRLAFTGTAATGPATLDFGQLLANYKYKLQVASAGGSGAFQDVQDVTATGSTSVTLATVVPGCYRLQRTDLCGSVIGLANSNATICTLGLTLTSVRGRNQLLLSDAGAGTSYTFTRDGRALTTTSLIRIAGGFEDTTVVCGARYTYQVTSTQAVAGGGTAASVSNLSNITTASSLAPPTPRLLASFNPANNVELTTTLGNTPVPVGGTLRYLRSLAGTTATIASTTTNRLVRDSTALATLLASPPCYSVRFADICGNASAESATACPSLLQATAADADATTAALRWTAFSGPTPSLPVTYLPQLVNVDGTVVRTLAATTALSTTDLLPPIDQQILRYRVQISGGGIPAGTFAYSNIATVTRQVRLQIPNAFTPNGDGLNDVLEVKGRFLRNYSFIVVDRNGMQVFRGTQRSETWDGTISGHAPVNGSYVWRFQQTDETGADFHQTGTVTILR